MKLLNPALKMEVSHIDHTQGDSYGFCVTIGEYEIYSANTEFLDEFGVEYKFSNSYIKKDGQRIMSWHVAAALCCNGDWENSWIYNHGIQTIYGELQQLETIYRESDNWYDCVRYARNLTGVVVY